MSVHVVCCPLYRLSIAFSNLTCNSRSVARIVPNFIVKIHRLCNKECLIFVKFFFSLLILQVDTEVCEQTVVVTISKMTHRMNCSTYLFFLLYICNLHNIRETEKLKRSSYL